MADLGYQVNLDAGEAYALASAVRSGAALTALPQSTGRVSVVAETPARPAVNAAAVDGPMCRPSHTAALDELFASV